MPAFAAGQAAGDPAITATGAFTEQDPFGGQEHAREVFRIVVEREILAHGPAAWTIDMGTSHNAGNIIPQPSARDSTSHSKAAEVA